MVERDFCNNGCDKTLNLLGAAMLRKKYLNDSGHII